MDALTNYIDASKARTAPRFAETRRLLAIWKDAFAIWQQQPSTENQLAVAQAHEAYKLEQSKAFGLANASKVQAPGFQTCAA